MKLQRRPLQSAPLVTVDENADPGLYAGHFVRVRPSSNTEDKALRELKRMLLKVGALAVRVMPKPPSDQLQLGSSAQVVEGMMQDDAVPPVRELMEMLVQTSTSQHKDELSDLLSRLADEEGL